MHADLQKAEILFDLDRNAEVAAACRRVLREDPHHVRAQYLLGYALLRLDEMEEAAEAARGLVNDAPENPEGYELLGWHAWKQGRPRDAAPHFRRALGIGPTSVHYRLLMASLLGDLERYEEAITHAREALSLEPDNPSVLSMLATLYRVNDELEMAEDFGRQALAADPEGADAHLEAGLRLLKGGGPKAAARSRFIDSLRLDPTGSGPIASIAHETVANHLLFRTGIFMPTERGMAIAALASPFLWFALGLLWAPFTWLGWLTVGILALGYGHLGLFHLLRRRARRRIEAGKL